MSPEEITDFVDGKYLKKALSNEITNSTLLWNNIGWSEDCLTVMYEKGKTNQDGAKKIPRHVYARAVARGH